MVNSAKTLVIWLFLLTVRSIYCDYEFPAHQVKFFKDGGFEVSIPKDESISMFVFHGKKNAKLVGRAAGTWNMHTESADGDKMQVQEANAEFNHNDTLHYWLHIVREGLGYDLLDQEKKSSDFEQRPSGLVKTSYKFTQPRIQPLNPSGFKFSLPAEEGMELVAFHGQINKPFTNRAAGTFSTDITTMADGEYVFKDTTTKFKEGDKLYYWLHVIYNGVGHSLENQVYEYRGVAEISESGQHDD